MVYGTLILWVAWLFFNGGSQGDLFVFRKNGQAKIIINTWLSGSVAGIVTVYVKPHILKTYSFVNRFDCTSLCNGILCGLVSVTGCCDRVEPWEAVIIGFIGAFFYILGCVVLEKFHVDDAVEAFPIHLFGGMWGTLATALFDNEFGLFNPSSPSRWSYLGWQMCGMVTILAWTAFFSVLFFYSMKRAGLLRIEKEIEIIGLDIAELGGMTDEMYQKIKIDYGNRNTIYTPDMETARRDPL